MKTIYGARAPLYFIDNNTDILGGKWHMKGELTKLGRRQHYEIGLKKEKDILILSKKNIIQRKFKFLPQFLIDLSIVHNHNYWAYIII